MHINRPLVAVAAVAASLLAASAVVLSTAAEGNSGSRVITAQLSGYQENPLALSSAGVGHFRARIDPSAGTITYRLRYDSLEGSVTQAHIHFGSPSQVGGVAAFLCTNLGNGPVGHPGLPAVAGCHHRHDPGRRRDRPRGPGHRGRRVRGAACGDPRRLDLRQRALGPLPGRGDPVPARARRAPLSAGDASAVAPLVRAAAAAASRARCRSTPRTRRLARRGVDPRPAAAGPAPGTARGLRLHRRRAPARRSACAGRGQAYARVEFQPRVLQDVSAVDTVDDDPRRAGGAAAGLRARPASPG